MRNLMIVISVVGALSHSAFAEECNLPKGELKSAEPTSSAVSPSGFEVSTFIIPSADCSSVRIWARLGKEAKEPTDEMCKNLGGDFSPYPGYLHCVDYQITKGSFDSKTVNLGATGPYGFKDKNGNLVLKRISPNAGLVTGTITVSDGDIFSKWNFNDVAKFHFIQNNPVLLNLEANLKKIESELNEKRLERDRALVSVLNAEIKQLKDDKTQLTKELRLRKNSVSCDEPNNCTMASDVQIKTLLDTASFGYGPMGMGFGSAIGVNQGEFKKTF